MAQDKHDQRGINLNDPDARPSDAADHEDRVDEMREEKSVTGGEHDDQGHTPKVPGAN
ncbi:hypothetical protein ABQX22_03910 [Xanthomonas sp. WHRI 1810A]|uniref:hypothetical protein n=1 Tax=Xanthomonas sp. WHRI 1810A TaxID=3161565 RepID=UPI0032E90092